MHAPGAAGLPPQLSTELPPVEQNNKKGGRSVVRVLLRETSVLDLSLLLRGPEHAEPLKWTDARPLMQARATRMRNAQGRKARRCEYGYCHAYAAWSMTPCTRRVHGALHGALLASRPPCVTPSLRHALPAAP